MKAISPEINEITLRMRPGIDFYIMITVFAAAAVFVVVNPEVKISGQYADFTTRLGAATIILTISSIAWLMARTSIQMASKDMHKIIISLEQAGQASD